MVTTLYNIWSHLAVWRTLQKSDFPCTGKYPEKGQSAELNPYRWEYTHSFTLKYRAEKSINRYHTATVNENECKKSVKTAAVNSSSKEMRSECKMFACTCVGVKVTVPYGHQLPPAFQA